MKNIILTGLMGSGKSSLGKAAAKATGMAFVDMDAFIERGAGMSVSELFEKFGEERFRDMETKTCYMLAQKQGQVIATGGGVILNEENITALSRSGIIIFVDRPLEKILADVDIASRPLLKEGADKLKKIYNERIDRYQTSAQIILENSCSEEETLSKLVNIIQSERRKEPKFAVIGDPISHSLSPEIHLPILGQYFDNPSYEKIQIKKGELLYWVRKVRDEGIDGFNLTMPHKVDIIPFLDQIDDEARLAGSVNTVVNGGGKLYGYTTDGQGFFASLLDAGVECKGANILILGAGGAASALTIRAVLDGAKSITILSRRLEQAETLKEYVTKRIPNAEILAGKMDTAATSRFSERSDIVINATPIGMEGVQATWNDLQFLKKIPKTAVVCDLIYKPKKTKLIEEAEHLGLKTKNGLDMLIYQAIIADEYYIGTPVDRVAMFELAKKNLCKETQL